MYNITCVSRNRPASMPLHACGAERVMPRPHGCLRQPDGFCITELVPGGRPTNDPKGTLVAVRLAARHLSALGDRARREGVSLSEALRRCVDDWVASRGGAAQAPPRTRPPTPEERETFKQVFSALGLTPARRRGRTKRRP